MARRRDHNSGRWPRLRSVAGRWCMTAAVTGLTGGVMLYKATKAYAGNAYQYCSASKTPACTSCPKNPTSTTTTACSQFLNGWKWGVCSSAWFSSSTCSAQNTSCVWEILCKANKQTGYQCTGGGQFDRCM